MVNDDHLKARTTAAVLLLLDPRLLAQSIVRRIPKPRDRCVQCNKKIPPGRAGRRCPECRGLAS